MSINPTARTTPIKEITDWAASQYGSGARNIKLIDQEEEKKEEILDNQTPKEGSREDLMRKLNEKLAANKKTTNYQSKKQGKLARKQTNKDAINKIKSDADKKIAEINTEFKGKPGYSDKDIKRKIKADKKAQLTQIKDKERGARRTDQQNFKIQRLANRNNVSFDRAAKMYAQRRVALSEFRKGPRQAAPYDVNEANAERARSGATRGNPYATEVKSMQAQWNAIGDDRDGATTSNEETPNKNQRWGGGPNEFTS